MCLISASVYIAGWIVVVGAFLFYQKTIQMVKQATGPCCAHDATRPHYHGNLDANSSVKEGVPNAALDKATHAHHHERFAADPSANGVAFNATLGKATRAQYQELLGANPSAKDVARKDAFFRRAMKDIQHIIRLRLERTSLHDLLKPGIVNDDLWSQYQNAEKEINLEIAEIVKNAEAFRQSWDQPAQPAKPAHHAIINQYILKSSRKPGVCIKCDQLSYAVLSKRDGSDWFYTCLSHLNDPTFVTRSPQSVDTVNVWHPAYGTSTLPAKIFPGKMYRLAEHIYCQRAAEQKWK